MDKNRKKGAVRQVQGSVKEITGKLTGDKPKEMEGKAEKNLSKGAVQGRSSDRRRAQPGAQGN